MSLYRYARDSRSNGQREQDAWQRKVDAKRQLIAELMELYPHLNTSGMRKLNNAQKALQVLLDNNPSDPV